MTSSLPVLRKILAGTAAAKCETETLDFKQAKPTLKEAFQDLAEACVCFANASGGTVIVGVADNKSGEDAFVGCDLDASLLRSKIHQLTMPSLLVDVREMEFVGKRLLEIGVPEGLEVYATAKGYTYQRINTDCLPMRPLDVTRLSEERRGFDWSATASGRPLDDVDPLALRYCRRLLAGSADPSRQRYAQFGDRDLLNALHAIADDGTLSRSGELMLCQNPSSLGMYAAVYQHKRTQSGEADAVLRVGAPLVLAFDEILQAMRARQGITPVTLADGRQLQIEDYPSAAIREALVNAFIHGDWRMKGVVQVEHSPQYLRIESPGPLVSGVTTSNILTRGSRARFPALASGFRLLGLAEEVGQGVDRMYREMIKSGRDVPVITEGPEHVAVLFRGEPPNTRIAKFVASLPQEEQDDTDAMIIIRMLCGKRAVRSLEVAPVIQRSPDEAQAALHRLAAEPVGVLEPTRATMRHRYPTYRLRANVIARLGSAVAYHSRATDDIDRKIIDHVRDYGEVNNRTIQRLFDVDVYQARDIIRDLVGRELLTRTSEQKRGTAVRYGPGPEFPRAGSRRGRRSATD
ncbi:putative DNA binding domain-containing protein [Nonomuraea sp. MCN248]|uniref:DNA binding domain-containing protein n=1 Tax=Nonomuraea corallina TaxID=2989783 RepID=A0ABT4SBI0_9ACTN|nr:RNA-binding domain-containing protein [Nonomuraea corallina]MDA0634286.1 putative DNA binding domain-containing protein [Nonomuraea corallina]